MELKEIKALIDLMEKNDLCEFELERDGMKVKIKRGRSGDYIPTFQPPVSSAPLVANTLSTTSIQPSQASTSATAATNEVTINSPMVGTFYASASPGTPPYVEVGQQVNEDTVVCIIEAMKVMNEIKAEVKGVITQILAENGKPVEFGKPLFKVKSA